MGNKSGDIEIASCQKPSSNKQGKKKSGKK